MSRRRRALLRPGRTYQRCGWCGLACVTIEYPRARSVRWCDCVPF